MTTITPVERYWSYVTEVLDGTQVAPQRIIRAAERSKAFKDDPDIYFDEEALNRFVSLSEQFIISDGHTLNGQTIQLSPWQLWSLGSFVAWKWKEDDGIVSKQQWVEVGRGAGKSAMAALLCIFTALEVPGCDISLLANKQEQSALILQSVHRFLRDTEGHGIDYESKAKEVRIGTSTIRALSAKVNALDGLRSRLYIIDEGHEARDDIFSKVLSALPKSRDAQMLSISTPGGTDLGLESVYYVTRTVAEEALRDFTKLKSVGAFLYGIDDDDPIDDPDLWVKGQPGLGHVITMVDYQRAYETYVAQNREGDWQRYQLCQYSLRSLGWIEPETIAEVSKPLDIMDFKGQKAYIGLDLSKSYDLSSMCIQFWKHQKCHAFWYHWVPAVGAREQYRQHEQHIPSWDKREFVEVVRTRTIDYDGIRDRLLWACEMFDIEKDCIGIDALGGLKPTLTSWEQEYDLPIIGVPQTITVLGPATFSFESLVREHQMTVRQDPVLEHCLQNVNLVVGVNGDRRPTKEKSTGCIDAVIAGIQATAIAIEQGALTPPAYKTSDDVVF